jgi:hypothetical protein
MHNVDDNRKIYAFWKFPHRVRCGIYVLVSELCGSVRTQVDFFGESILLKAMHLYLYQFREPSIGLSISEKKVILFGYLESTLDKYIIDVP